MLRVKSPTSKDKRQRCRNDNVVLWPRRATRESEMLPSGLWPPLRLLNHRPANARLLRAQIRPNKAQKGWQPQLPTLHYKGRIT
jgi:hypothetical protein